MSKYHVYHISFIDAILKGLENKGVSLERFCATCDLKYFNFRNPDAYLPLPVAYQFVNKVNPSLGIGSEAFVLTSGVFGKI